jgi:mono/diheme cytochrome c family protein
MKKLMFFLMFVMAFAGCKHKGGKLLPEQSAAVHPGKVIYNTYCLACHQTDGSGVPGLYPPLRKADWEALDNEQLINILLQGVSGEIEVDGMVYNGQMPAHQYLTDEQIADVLTYLRSEYGKITNEITPAEVSSKRSTIQEK